ncbi:unnamed protein product [marine sediment metagenome]|uniref:Uncharacterized protein n=1 Tax=marine sediment metagenome TaxID=412755 RepID=X1RXD0_9ZZZZ
MGKGLEIKVVEAKPWPAKKKWWQWLIFLIISLIALFGFKKKK